ncbi:hypothetical protein Ac2012v2_004422 [Leucoagaricus gongylophorus]
MIAYLIGKAILCYVVSRVKPLENSIRSIDEALPGVRPAKKIKVVSLEGLTNSDAADDRPVDPPSAVHLLSLRDLLDFTSLDDEVAITNRFDMIARVLMHEHQLVVHCEGAETAFEIQEMEFYLQKDECYEDPFTHGSEEQKVSGRWYFHRAPRRSNDASRSSASLTAYRGGTRKGLDLTIGGLPPRTISSYFGDRHGPRSTEFVRGGILLRGLRSLTKDGAIDTNLKKNSVYGPSLLVDRILNLNGASSISELVEVKWGGDTSALDPPSASSTSSRTSYLYLKPVTCSIPSLPKIHKSPRIGLDLSHPGITIPNDQSTLIDCHPRIRFLPKMLRYYTRPGELTKGRAQSIYGFIHTALATRFDFRDDNYLSRDKAFRAILTEAIGVKDALVEKYLWEYDAGRKEGLKHLALCVGPGGKGAADSPTSYLKMMGAFDAALLLPGAQKDHS